jgi:hypothetical protein
VRIVGIIPDETGGLLLSGWAGPGWRFGLLLARQDSTLLTGDDLLPLKGD